ncbi:MAG: hypothetical protein A2821_00880 [Candidatus Magasanikbacteria bacterium RIFCSPHIGHO2_01_FULL_41_23]|uniref:Uncharacterized protein n=1 Tax=Candidatus Magasanikbacteria bacterium RIFCSPLOWO2_01_FULL_40_15 TaxID=1798686 RepID=A0A1F6N1C2_9BACT|nr:MAG: hypothetical protein A2821_00880 [Candidatus Magasanikbacteria bacterium RIFCSPHIGHO2_01_FULL_41_23]OGH74729.1 MAG: hypothetical protein A3F22_02235 [Candidatus Magasanikbacteria bacterium RIFCSPHIGHO2_12_FULL_41_16]OGH77443.1 MAG: hypothetical protein A2983_01935 [Candidatus Magasanikbacteria bacterium RIFCSPLOWO2_01_FULL_40_15]
MPDRFFLSRVGISSIFFGFLLTGIFAPSMTQAIGISPGTLEAENLANGVDISRTLILTNTASEEDVFFSIKARGEAASYISLPKSPIVIPAGQNRANIDIHIKPMNAQNGKHTAELEFMSQPNPNKVINSSGNSVSITSGVIAHVVFTVTDQQIKTMFISNVSADDTEIDKPVIFGFSLLNTGNVDVKPERIDAVFVDITDPANIISETISGSSLEYVLPGELSRINAGLTKNLPLGEYSASFSFYLDDKVISTLKTDRIIKVWPTGTLAQAGSFDSFKINGNTFESGDLVKLTGLFTNTGGVVLDPIWYVEITKDGKIIDLMRAEKKTVGKGQNVEYTLTFRPDSKGEYTFDAYFEYGIKKTAHKLETIIVSSAVGFVSYIFIIVFIIILAVGVWYFKHHYKKS